MAKKIVSVPVDVNETHEVEQKDAKGNWRTRKYTLGELYEEYVGECEEKETEPVKIAEWLRDLMPYGAKRHMALHKDGERYAAGKKPTTIYVSRTHDVDGAKKDADKKREEAKQQIAKSLGVEYRKPEPKAPPTRKQGGAAASL